GTRRAAHHNVEGFVHTVAGIEFPVDDHGFQLEHFSLVVSHPAQVVDIAMNVLRHRDLGPVGAQVAPGQEENETYDYRNGNQHAKEAHQVLTGSGNARIPNDTSRGQFKAQDFLNALQAAGNTVVHLALLEAGMVEQVQLLVMAQR